MEGEGWDSLVRPIPGFRAEPRLRKCGEAPGRYSQYTKMKRPSQTTSTKCQYQAAASKAK